MDPQTLGGKPRVKVRPKGLICPSNGLPKWPFDVGMIIQAWTCTCMQGNTKRINANHWMEVNTNGGMDGLVTWIKRPTFHMKKRPNTLGEQHHTVHHTMAVDPTPRERIPGWPASSWPAGHTFWPIGPSQVGGCFNRRCKKEYGAFDRRLVDQEAGRHDISTPRAQLRMEVTSTDLLA